VAWGIVLLLVAVMVAINHLPMPDQAGGEDKLGLALMRIQSQYMVYVAHWQGGPAVVYGQSHLLNDGTISQRQRYVTVAGELAGPSEARDQLAELEDLIRDEIAVRPDEVTYTPGQQQVSRILATLYAETDAEAGTEADAPAPAELIDADDRSILVKELGWFGELALAPSGGDDPAAREAVLAPARRVMFVIVSAFACLAGGALIGFIGLAILLILALLGRVPGGIGRSEVDPGVYIETFAIWMLLLLAFQIPAGLAAAAVPKLGLGLTVLAFFLSLLALAWPLWRGVPWAQVRQDIGWTTGRTPWLEPVVGLGGYLMALPMLAAGVAGTLVLLLLQQFLTAPVPPLEPAGGPAHPVILELTTGGVLPKVMVLILASVAAPIVEETMFRGVLYRHLRDATGRLAPVLSVLASATIGGFIFAIIHPQGLVAVPALMGLAYGFTLVREWRGTLIPAMVVHGVSNGLVMSLLIVVLTA
jgi:membrane protease YdiL (CAAX protease family)